MSVEIPWPCREAKRIADFVGDNREVVLQTGFGPSGKPHIGTYGEIVRTAFVALALGDLGRESRIISFLDDLDGLRKVPGGFPGWLSEYLGRPVCEIPDPFGCCKSFSKHMQKLLEEMIQETGIRCDYVLSSEEYRRGTFNDVIETVMQDIESLKSMVVPMLSDEVGEKWFPFFAKCENCGKLYTTEVVGMSLEAQTVDYVCDGQFGDVSGCGHRGTASYLSGGGKLPWRVDWPARWLALDVDYEIHGKDLIESANLGKRIVSKVFVRKPPLTMVYELFLSADGSKISKSKGIGLDPPLWLRYGTRDSLHLMLYKKPKQAKRLDVNRMPDYVNEALDMAADYFEKRDTASGTDGRHPYEFVRLFSPPESAPLKIDFATLCNLVAALGERDADMIKEYAAKLGRSAGEATSDADPQTSAWIDELVEKAILFVDEVMRSEAAPALELADGEVEAVREFVKYLRSAEVSGEETQTAVFDIARQHSITQPRIFQILYTLIIGQQHGPRLGEFITILGQDRTAERLEASLAKTLEGRE